MSKNCNLELSLASSSESDHHRQLHEQQEQSNVNESQQQHDKQQLTIFYDGRIYTCDVTEIQARAIIRKASREDSSLEKDKIMWKSALNNNYGPPKLAYADHNTAAALSMKRSLQKFLHKRSHRIRSTASPYNNNNNNNYVNVNHTHQFSHFS